MSATSNYTPIDDLVKSYKSELLNKSVTISHEREPPKSQPKELSTVAESTESREIAEEVKPYVEVLNDKLELDPDLTNAGLQLADQGSIPPYFNIKLPISDDKVVKGLHAPVYTSLRWLSTWGVYLLWKVHIQLKIVHGRVIRVFKP